MMAKPNLRVVEGSPALKTASPDRRMRALVRRRQRLQTEIRRVEGELFEHRRRKADERGQIPPLSLDELIAELGIGR